MRRREDGDGIETPWQKEMQVLPLRRSFCADCDEPIPDDDRTSEEFVRDALARMDWYLSAPPIGRGMWEEIKPCPACGEHTCTATQVRMGMVCSRCYEERILRRENEDAGDD